MGLIRERERERGKKQIAGEVVLSRAFLKKFWWIVVMVVVMIGGSVCLSVGHGGVWWINEGYRGIEG